MSFKRVYDVISETMNDFELRVRSPAFVLVNRRGVSNKFGHGHLTRELRAKREKITDISALCIYSVSIIIIILSDRQRHTEYCKSNLITLVLWAITIHNGRFWGRFQNGRFLWDQRV